MKDSLRFRFPGEGKQHYSGELKVFDPSVQKNGFIVTDFTIGCTYYFAVSAENDADQLFFSEKRPVVISKEEYLEAGTTFLNELRKEHMGKAIFSRIKEEDFESTKTEFLFDALCEQYPDALVYLLSSRQCGTWIGASPEVLLETDDHYMYTMALAGTKKNEAAEWTQKEVDEQQYVADFIVEELKECNVEDLHIVGPFDFHAGPVVHLRTDIAAQLNGSSIWEVAKKLHPTPAVSGLPRKEAIALIHRHEPHDRSLYSGMIGFLSDDFTRLFVNLRCGQIMQDKIYLYVGGGYTQLSDVEHEWQETENKSRTLLNVIEHL